MIEWIIIIANLKCAHWHWHNPGWHVGTHLLSLKAKLYPTNRELTIISTSCHIRHRLIIHGKTGENKFVSSFEVWPSWTTIISPDSDLFSRAYYHSPPKTHHVPSFFSWIEVHWLGGVGIYRFCVSEYFQGGTFNTGSILKYKYTWCYFSCIMVLIAANLLLLQNQIFHVHQVSSLLE